VTGATIVSDRVRSAAEQEATRAARATTALTAEERASFTERGWLRLRAAFPRDAALEMQRRMWSELHAVHGIVRARPETWFQPRAALRDAKRDPLQHAIASDRVLAAVGDLLVAVPWSPPRNWGIVLITFPDRASHAWTLPAAGWHYDFDLLENASEMRGLQVFAFAGDVAPRGGGTLVVEGSHRVLQRFVAALSADERRADHQTLRRRALRHDPWLRMLIGRDPQPPSRVDFFLADTGDSRGIPLRVVELTGEPGDVILCHPLLLHAAARNVARVPRFMRSQRICAGAAVERATIVDAAPLRSTRTAR
jgi:hypothetical protein